MVLIFVDLDRVKGLETPGRYLELMRRWNQSNGGSIPCDKGTGCKPCARMVNCQTLRTIGECEPCRCLSAKTLEPVALTIVLTGPMLGNYAECAITGGCAGESLRAFRSRRLAAFEPWQSVIRERP